MVIGDFAEAFDFGCDYLKECGGSEIVFREGVIDSKWRIGQAFYNALSRDDRDKIIMKPEDPFFSSEPNSIFLAIRFLMDH